MLYCRYQVEMLKVLFSSDTKITELSCEARLRISPTFQMCYICLLFICTGRFDTKKSLFFLTFKYTSIYPEAYLSKTALKKLSLVAATKLSSNTN